MTRPAIDSISPFFIDEQSSITVATDEVGNDAFQRSSASFNELLCQDFVQAPPHNVVFTRLEHPNAYDDHIASAGQT